VRFGLVSIPTVGTSGVRIGGGMRGGLLEFGKVIMALDQSILSVSLHMDGITDYFAHTPS